jgi:hypothetical protein
MAQDLAGAMADTAQRMINAENDFIELIMRYGKCSKDQAEKVLRVYRKMKFVKNEYNIGRISVKHGLFLEEHIIWTAINFDLKGKVIK